MGQLGGGGLVPVGHGVQGFRIFRFRGFSLQVQGLRGFGFGVYRGVASRSV